MNRDVCEHFIPVDLTCAKCDMKRQSEALFLADELELPLGTVIQSEVLRRAAKELRKSHMVEQLYTSALDGRNAMHLELHKLNMATSMLRSQRDALLEALKLIVEFVDAPTEGKRPDVFVMRISKARAAIKKAEEA